MSNKKYGLILPDKGVKQPVFQASKNVFGDDESDEDTQTKSLISSTSKRQAKAAQEKAIIEDPTVYQYDEVYDNIKEKINEEKQKIKSDKTPKYIENLLKTAQKRKLENERRVERQVHKEREKEGDEFADKEVFVTSAYKLKLEEMRKEEEKEKYEDFLENIGDVTKQRDLGGFYRHIYEQKLGPVKNEQKKSQVEEKVESDVNDDEKGSSKLSRNYRKRNKSLDAKVDLSEGEIVSDEEINRMNLEDIQAAKKARKGDLDADSDFSVNDPSENESEDEKQIKDNNKNEDNVDTQLKKEEKEVNGNTNENEKDLISEKEKSLSKLKVDIWKKRTVGIIFDEALKRYYERKATRAP